MPYCMYLRKSRKDSENPSFTDEEILSRHQQLLEETAERQGLQIAAIYREIVSGDSIAGRPVMQRLLREVSAGQWDGVLVVEIERLARGDTEDQGAVAKAFQYSGTQIVTPLKTYDPANEGGGDRAPGPRRHRRSGRGGQGIPVQRHPNRHPAENL